MSMRRKLEIDIRQVSCDEYYENDRRLLPNSTLHLSDVTFFVCFSRIDQFLVFSTYIFYIKCKSYELYDEMALQTRQVQTCSCV